MDHLSRRDQFLFFTLWSPLLDYANSTLHLLPDVRFQDPTGLMDYQQAYQVT